MSRTTRRSHPGQVAYHRGSACGAGWYEYEAVFSPPQVLDGKATTVPSGKRFKATYRRIEKRRRNHALRTGDVLTASAPEKECLWKAAWY